ncbi:hypothetical protein L249_4385 [Ophiocordyceps polyrhachis-furcata BCC 54312]|uniref:MT-A70 family n=1 Tax=Ophiocordyceps polyrhachis-furcata BCC 54312 TaxID=1330021 RepID=A0A367L822_9HYPO|nr:hypothetical protein L249_4385 [Ophiocordyceps polyrhachis-furcata BCC 54312]
MASTPPLESILFRSADESVILLDIPRSLEESQVPIGEQPTRRLRSGPPPPKPLPTPEPKDAQEASSLAAATQVAHLMTAEAARRALQLLADYYTGPFCLERLSSSSTPSASSSSSASHTNPGIDILVPDGARYICGSIEETKQALLDEAPPSFDLIVLDPPWPNRSVRRHADSYHTPRDLSETRRLLLQVPVSARLAPDGLVAVWITNKPAVYSLMTSPTTGVLAAWGLELAAEWTWLKVAESGEPLYDLDSLWRKPWEKLLIATPRGGRAPSALTAKVIVAVPDVHSRKPNLGMLFRDVLARDYVGLEVFARNLISGWWSWGDEVVKFQQVDCWLQPC